MEECAALGTVSARSRIIETEPLGPALRRFANAALVIESELDPDAMLSGLKKIERDFGRRSARRWGDRVVDLDIILWSEGAYVSNRLTIPHSEFRNRDFVLRPANEIAANWRDPMSGLLVRHLLARLP